MSLIELALAKTRPSVIGPQDHLYFFGAPLGIRPIGLHRFYVDFTANHRRLKYSVKFHVPPTPDRE